MSLGKLLTPPGLVGERDFVTVVLASGGSRESDQLTWVGGLARCEYPRATVTKSRA